MTVPPCYYGDGTGTSFLRELLNNALGAMALGSIFGFKGSLGAGYFGQGKVFRAIGEYFSAEKQRAAIWYPVQPLPEHRQPVLKRKTMRSLVAPLANKGWKGKR